MGEEELDGEDTGDTEFCGDLHREFLGLLRESRGKVGRGRDRLGADAGGLDRFHDRPRRAAPGGGSGDHRRQFPVEADLLLRHERDPAAEQLGDQPDQFLPGSGEPDPLAVVSTAARLQTDPAVDLVEEVGGVIDRSDRGERGYRCSEIAQPFPHDQLVLRVDQCIGTGLDVDPGVDQRTQVPGGYVLMVEGDDVRALGGRLECREVGVVADDDIGGDLGGRSCGRSGEKPHGLSHLDRGGLHHPGELTVADDGDYRHSGGVRLVVSTGGQGITGMVAHTAQL